MLATVLFVFLTAFTPAAHAEATAATNAIRAEQDDCVDAIRQLTSLQTLAYKVGQQVHAQLLAGRPWSDTTIEISLVRREISRLASALEAKESQVRDLLNGAYILDQLKRWADETQTPNGTLISMARYSTRSYEAIGLLDTAQFGEDYGRNDAIEGWRPLNYDFEFIEQPTADRDILVRIPYRTQLHPLTFLLFYLDDILTWETAIEGRFVDDINMKAVQEISEHDFYIHQNLLASRFRQDTRQGTYLDFELETRNKKAEFKNFLSQLFSHDHSLTTQNLKPNQLKHELSAYLIWFPVHEASVPATLENILIYYEKGIVETKRGKRLESPTEIFDAIWGRLTKPNDLGGHLQDYTFYLPELRSVADELLAAIRKFQAQGTP